MTKEQAIEKLREIQNSNDTEGAHQKFNPNQTMTKKEKQAVANLAKIAAAGIVEKHHLKKTIASLKREITHLKNLLSPKLEKSK